MDFREIVSFDDIHSQTLAQIYLNHPDVFYEIKNSRYRSHDSNFQDLVTFLYERGKRIAIRKDNPNKWRVRYIKNDAGLISDFKIIPARKTRVPWTGRTRDKKALDFLFPKIIRDKPSCEALGYELRNYLFDTRSGQINALEAENFFMDDANFLEKNKNKNHKIKAKQVDGLLCN
ncbi:hypothetical protein A9Q91_02000 [Candidatus Gracilibacteria bacterium 28_42_T64]|nr:hypothetical protein A9Q91_02000 [Candidatus Gracilibacteria bacterium 28_42_T64]